MSYSAKPQEITVYVCKKVLKQKTNLFYNFKFCTMLYVEPKSNDHKQVPDLPWQIKNKILFINGNGKKRNGPYDAKWAGIFSLLTKH